VAQITTYATLVSAMQDWSERSDFDEDQIIGLAEADFRLYLGPHYARETAATSLAFTSGSAAQPSGFIRPTGLVHATYGALDEASMAAVRAKRVWDTSGIPTIFAVTGSTIQTASTYTGNLTLDYEANLTGLSSGNTTNWLIANAPQAYLSMCQSYAAAWEKNFAEASTLRGEALRVLNDLGIQSMVAQHGRAAVQIPGVTP